LRGWPEIFGLMSDIIVYVEKLGNIKVNRLANSCAAQIIRDYETLKKYKDLIKWERLADGPASANSGTKGEGFERSRKPARNTGQ
jgi:hypothetical protein